MLHPRCSAPAGWRHWSNPESPALFVMSLDGGHLQRRADDQRFRPLRVGHLPEHQHCAHAGTYDFCSHGAGFSDSRSCDGTSQSCLMPPAACKKPTVLHSRLKQLSSIHRHWFHSVSFAHEAFRSAVNSETAPGASCTGLPPGTAPGIDAGKIPAHPPGSVSRARRATIRG